MSEWQGHLLSCPGQLKKVHICHKRVCILTCRSPPSQLLSQGGSRQEQLFLALPPSPSAGTRRSGRWPPWNNGYHRHYGPFPPKIMATTGIMGLSHQPSSSPPICWVGLSSLKWSGAISYSRFADPPGGNLDVLFQFFLSIFCQNILCHQVSDFWPKSMADALFPSHLLKIIALYENR